LQKGVDGQLFLFRESTICIFFYSQRERGLQKGVDGQLFLIRETTICIFFYSQRERGLQKGVDGFLQFHNLTTSLHIYDAIYLLCVTTLTLKMELRVTT
jgi:hypothetical protein